MERGHPRSAALASMHVERQRLGQRLDPLHNFKNSACVVVAINYAHPSGPVLTGELQAEPALAGEMIFPVLLCDRPPNGKCGSFAFTGAVRDGPHTHL